MLRWSRTRARSFPWRRTRSPFRVLVGELLLQRTRGENVVAVYDALLHRWPAAQDLAVARLRSLHSVMRPLGLTKRVPIIKSCAQVLVRDFSGRVPKDPNELKRLPGVGPYTANAVQIFARDENLPLVDWVIARLLRRYFGLPDGSRPNADLRLWALATQLTDKGRARQLWIGVLDFAADVCAPRPRCDICPLRHSCNYYRKRRVTRSSLRRTR